MTVRLGTLPVPLLQLAWARCRGEFEDKLRVKTSTETTRVTEETGVVTIKIPSGKVARVMWTLVDRYTLKRYDGTQIGVWEVASKTVTDEQSFSPPEVILDPIEDPVSPLIDTTAPRVTSVTPADDKRNVALNTNITATFSEKMDPITINESTFQLYKLDHNRAPARITNVAVSLSPDGLMATLNPFGQSSRRLEKHTRYRAVITTGAKDVAGNALDQDGASQDSENKVWTFTTRD
jgi:hypothetical protein